MRIPKRFKLAGITITVEETNNPMPKNLLGESRYFEQKIILSNRACAQETKEQSFIHELIHWIFYILNEDVLRNDEKIVDTFSYLLHQFLTTAEYDD